MLAAAVELADYPLLSSPQCEGFARSDTCGSTITMHLDLDAADRICQFGMLVQACAVGQASAAIFARHAIGLSASDAAAAASAFDHWIKGEERQPEWPDCELIAAAIDYPARHSAMMLPWKAAYQALSSVPASR